MKAIERVGHAHEERTRTGPDGQSCGGTRLHLSFHVKLPGFPVHNTVGSYCVWSEATPARYIVVSTTFKPSPDGTS